jgi:PQQ-dependent dehydrogenase (s-GDH family)
VAWFANIDRGTLMMRSLRLSILGSYVVGVGILLAQDSPDSVLPETKRFQKAVLVSGLSGPWELTWGPDNMLWVTERTGKRIVRIDPSNGKRTVAIEIPEVSSPGSQDGLLGLAIHPELLKGTGSNYVYAAYTYVDQSKGVSTAVSDSRGPYRYLYEKIVRLTYDAAAGTLSKSADLITGLPVGNDHVSGRLKIGPDRKLYFTIGDEGHNQLGNFCLPIESQRLPTQQEVDSKNYAAYVGKSLRLNLDGSIPSDNPRLNGVISHVYTYGHRNMQGIDFGPDGTLYASEQGPKTDDEINILRPGANYGWPHVAGLKDDKAYEYARWADASTPCRELSFSDLAIPAPVPHAPESAFTKPFVEPIATLFTVPSGYNFRDPACKGVDFVCWPTVGASSIEYYASKGKGILGWDRVLLVTALKRGSLYVVPLSADGRTAAGHISRYFQSENRYRDTAVSPDGRTIYIATDPGGTAEALTGGATGVMQNPGAILSFTYVGEGATEGISDLQPKTKAAGVPESRSYGANSGVAPQYSAEQAAAGKASYNSNCAVCHGNTMTNGTFGPPLAGEYFDNAWGGKTLRTLYDRARTMPPSAAGSLDDETYTNIIAYILEVNGVKAGGVKLQRDKALDTITIGYRQR